MNQLKLDQQSLDHLLLMVWGYAPRLLLALITLFVGFWISKRISKSLIVILKLNQVDPSLAKWLGSFLSITLKAIIIISVASMIGVETTSFIAVLGAAGLAVGLALQGSLANFAGGLLILFFKPFIVGDYILAQDEEGFVDSIDIFCTYLRTFDHRIVILPNGALAGEKIINHTRLEKRRVDITIGISYKDDFKLAEKVLTDLALSYSCVLKDPPPVIDIQNYAESSVNLVIKVWCMTPNYWDVHFYLNNNLKITLDKANISIPFPQREVHLFNH